MYRINKCTNRAKITSLTLTLVSCMVAVILNTVGYQFGTIKSISPPVQHGIVYNQIEKFATKYMI